MCSRRSNVRSSSPMPAGEGGDVHALVLLRSSSSPSCEHIEAEIDDFLTATNPSAESKVSPVPGGSCGGGAAARLLSASEMLVRWDPRDLLN